MHPFPQFDLAKKIFPWCLACPKKKSQNWKQMYKNWFGGKHARPQLRLAMIFSFKKCFFQRVGRKLHKVRKYRMRHK